MFSAISIVLECLFHYYYVKRVTLAVNVILSIAEDISMLYIIGEFYSYPKLY